jgi:anti-sigma B factor antagonist
VEIQIKHDGDTVVMHISGRLDMATGSALKDQVKKLSEQGKRRIHMNLRNVDFINSSGLGALVSIMKEIRLHRGRLTLSDLAGYVREIFEITQLSHIFEIFATEDEALYSQPAMVVG